jgi:hypothetical protein
VLDRESVSVRASFFDLGGHSLLATRLIARVNKVFRTQISLGRLFEKPTVSEMANALIDQEAKPGYMEKIAKALMRVKSMSSEDKKKMLQSMKNEGIKYDGR